MPAIDDHKFISWRKNLKKKTNKKNSLKPGGAGTRGQLFLQTGSNAAVTEFIELYKVY